MDLLTMNLEHIASVNGQQAPFLPVEPPIMWPEPRWLAGQVRYEANPPFKPLLARSDLVAGVLVGVADGTIQWLRTLMEQEPPARPANKTAGDISAEVPKKAENETPRLVKGLDELFGGEKLHNSCDVRLVVLVYPAGPTREAHLLTLKILQADMADKQRKLEVRVLPTARSVGAECERMVVPPTLLLGHDSQAGKTWFCIGSVGDAGHDTARLASFNAVFHPDAAFCDQWRRWFQYLFGCAVPLTTETVRIPALVPAQGDPAGAALWGEYQLACSGTDSEAGKRPAVDPKTGEVAAEADGSPVKPWDGGKVQLDPLAQKLQQVYAGGWLVTVDETTRVKPLAIPVKPTQFDEQAERAVGAVTQKQSFSLKVLDAGVTKEVEKCRNVADIMELLGYQLCKGNRWIPDLAKVLLERELEARNKQGMARLKEALGSKQDARDAKQQSLPAKPGAADGTDGVKKYLESRKEALRHDLDAMYRELRRGDSVPPEKLEEVLASVEARLTAALGARITPRVNYNRLTPPDLTNTAPDEHWAQPLSLLLQSAVLLRISLTDNFFSRNFTKRSFTPEEFESAMNVFDDAILKKPDPRRAKEELIRLDEIEKRDQKNKEKCHAVWQLITSAAP
jgi:hypothetical protein